MDKPNPEYRPLNQADGRKEMPALTPIESRQGIMLGRMRWVLGISLALVIIAMLSLYAVHYGSDPHRDTAIGTPTTTTTAPATQPGD